MDGHLFRFILNWMLKCWLIGTNTGPCIGACALNGGAWMLKFGGWKVEPDYGGTQLCCAKLGVPVYGGACVQFGCYKVPFFGHT